MSEHRISYHRPPIAQQPVANIPLRIALVGGALLFLAVCGGVGWQWYRLSQQRDAVVRLEQQRKEARLKSAQLEKRLDELRTAEQEITDLRNRTATEAQKLVSQDATLAQLKQQWQTANSSMMSAVEQVRQASLTTPVPKLVDAKGTVLTNVKLAKVQPGVIILEHDAGMRRIAFKDVPPEVEDRFQLNWWPELQLPPTPPDHPSVAALTKSFVVPARDPIPEVVVAEQPTAVEVESETFFQATVYGIRTEMSKINIFLEDAARQIAAMKAQEDLAGRKDAKTLSLSRGMDAMEVRKQIHDQRFALERRVTATRKRYKELEVQLKKLNK